LVWICFVIRADDYSNCFIPGEVAEYKVSWMGLPLAWSKTTTETITEDGRELIRIRLISKSYKAYTHIYRVDDRTEVIIDPKTALPVRLDLTLNEGNRHRSYLTTFHHDKKVAIFQDRINKDIKEVPIESGTQDTLSFLYSQRNHDLESLAAGKHQLYVDGKLYNLGIKIRSTDDIRLPAYGKVPSIEIEPVAEFDGLFLRQGKIMFWVSKQNRRMVTCIKAKVPVGKLNVKLQKVSGPGDDFWVNNK
jgi:hypothetical protein